MRLSKIKLNEARTISLENEFWSIIVNKNNHTIIQTKQCDEDICKDVTEECEQMERNYTIGDMVIEKPYKLGMVMSKLLNNRIDKRCISSLCYFKIQLTE